MTPLLTLQGVSKSFPLKEAGLFGRRRGVVTALDQITVDVHKGETVSIVGESGCGKSTLARTAAMLLAPDSGTVKFNGQDVHRLRAREKRALRRQMHLVFQDPYGSLNPRLSVGEIVGEPLIIHKIGDTPSRIEKVKKSLTEVGLQPHDLSKYPHQFSGGQRQRIALARALILRPELIIADEPLSALDVSVQSQIINLLADLKKTHHLTYMIISHDLSVVSHVSDRVIVMYQGRIMEAASAESLFQKPQHPYTQLLLATAPRLRGTARIRARQHSQGTEVRPPLQPGCPFAPRCQKIQEICRLAPPGLGSAFNARKSHQVACHFPEIP
ncbi:MAG: hypothetical protein CBD27_04630 [Rhodospirillaceae bacterium TMED167]|nr:hypothetical protein [Rhodospirillaceae bacterium]OUW28447.1 MAG: hypothetical protein CBD27_04630 [Rhodospirillaceae bacterium TMED167]